jgi:hypothetical protein
VPRQNFIQLKAVIMYKADFSQTDEHKEKVEEVGEGGGDLILPQGHVATSENIKRSWKARQHVAFIGKNTKRLMLT